jgi:hypothetical protein
MQSKTRYFDADQERAKYSVYKNERRKKCAYRSRIALDRISEKLSENIKKYI